MGPDRDVELDALLQPSLTVEDDAVGFARPWNPWSAVFAYFFAGPFTGGVLLALNFKRLGSRRMVWRCVLLCGGIGLAASVGYLALIHTGVTESWTSSQVRLLSTGARVIGLLPALWMASLQSRRFRIYSSTGEDPSGLWIWGLGAVIAGLGVNIAVTGLILEVMGWSPIAEAGA